MTHWHNLPRQIRRQILREFCNSVAFDFLNYQSRFKTEIPYEIVWRNSHPQPLISYLNALLTCREFHDAITKEITIIFDQSTSLTLQTTQYHKLIKYSDKLFMNGSNDYREITLAQAMFGCFWRNPFICEVYPIFDDMFGGLEYTGKLVLVCLLEGVLEKCKKYVSPPHEYIKTQKADVDGSFHGLVFSRGSYYVGGDCICFYTVSNWEFATFKDHDSKEVHGYYDSDAENRIERLSQAHRPRHSLPNISSSERDSWWLGENIGGRDNWKQWYLVNYKERKIVVGPNGQGAEWPDNFDLESLPLWTYGNLDESFHYEFHYE